MNTHSMTYRFGPLFLVLSTFFLLSFISLTKKSKTPIKETEGYNVGDYVKDFSAKNIDGKNVSLLDFSDKRGVIVIFTCNHCPYAKKYDSRKIQLDRKFKDKGYPVLAINPNDAVEYPSDSYDSMVYYAKEKGYTFPYLHDETQEIAKQFGAQKTPHVYLLSYQKKKKGFRVEYIGAIDNNYKDPEAVTEKYVEDAIMALMDNKKPKVTSTKAIGCGIKWKKSTP